jgi:hypothetical protein
VTREQLQAAWDEWLQPRGTSGPSQGQNWRNANPLLWPKLKAYRDGTGPRPTVHPDDHTGNEHLILADVWLALTAPDPTEPEPPRGTLSVRDGGGTRSSFPDCWMTTAAPFTVQGKHVKNVTFAGVGSQQQWQNGLPIENPGRTLIEDCIIENVRQAPAGGSGGTGEAGAWLGNPTDMRRVVIRNFAWMGVNLVGRGHHSNLTDVLIDGGPVGVYFEHYAHTIRLERVKTSTDIRTTAVAGGSEPLGLLAGRSFTFEWVYSGIYGRVGPHTVEFIDCPIYCPPEDPRFLSGPTGFDPSSGVYIGPGCHSVKFLGSTYFYGPGVGVWAPTQRLGPDIYIAPTVQFRNGGARVKYHNLPMGP